MPERTGARGQLGGRVTIEMKNSSIWRTTLMNWSKSTGLVT